MLEMVKAGNDKLIGEVIGIQGDETIIQVYENTTGMKPGEACVSMGKPMSCTLEVGIIGNIFDGIERPLKDIRDKSGSFIARGVNSDSLDNQKEWDVTFCLKPGDKCFPGTIIAEIPETSLVTFKLMVPYGITGKIAEIKPNGKYRVTDVVAVIETDCGIMKEITLCQEWPIRKPRPAKYRKPIQKPLITGQRVVDTILPIAKGGTAAIPGGFGTGASYEEMVEITCKSGEHRWGRIIEVYEEKAVIQVFEGTTGISLTNTSTKLTGKPLEISLSKEIIGRVFNGMGKPVDGLGDIFPDETRDINGTPINPVSRRYPNNFIQTGISSIDCLNTLIRGQKLPIFSGNGLPHDNLAVQIVRQATLSEGDEDNFAIVFAAMGIKHDVETFFRRSFEKSGVLQKVVMFLNLADDPVVERIVTPRCALTAAEYLAFKHNMQVLVIMTDMTSYAEALREISSSKGEIPSRKGYPGYLYSDLASMFERAGIIEGSSGSITQIPILTMPNDDITHPIPDLTGYITEGQIVLDRSLSLKSVYPPVAALSSLSRLMKDGIGEGFTREDHVALSNQLFSSYARVGEARALASVIGEDELGSVDKLYMKFGREFEEKFIGQGKNENRSIQATLDMGWSLLRILPKSELDRVDDATLNKYYKEV
ncbi:v-type proton atpase subunit b [Holotrichia oblita]|nr:v-type proton atpase subunit b [Holotrichia oblita]